MLATCVVAGWPTQTYLEPDHPLQVAIKETVAELAGEKVAATGVDGCGAPLFALSLDRPGPRVPRARARRARHARTPGRRRHARPPAMDVGHRPRRTPAHGGVPGLLIKSGAEGVDAFALADGRAGAIKIDDGAARARTPVTVATLRALGVEGVPAELTTAPVHGGESIVGEIRAIGF